jgi:hypothetical protein
MHASLSMGAQHERRLMVHAAFGLHCPTCDALLTVATHILCRKDPSADMEQQQQQQRPAAVKKPRKQRVLQIRKGPVQVQLLQPSSKLLMAGGL